MRDGALIRHDQGMTPAPAERVVDALIGAHLLDPSAREASMPVVAGALERGEPEDTDHRALPQLVEVVAYLGGALVVAAGVLFLVQEWDGLGFATRVALFAVVSVVLLAAGVVATRVPAGRPGLLDPANDVRRRLGGALFAFGALSTAFLVGLVVDQAMTTEFPDIYWPSVAGAAAGTAVAAIGYRIAPSAVGVVAVMAGVVTMLLTFTDQAYIGSEGDSAGLLFASTGVLWLVITELGAFREITVARTLGVALTLVGAQAPVIDGTHAWLGYLLTLGVVIGGIALYLRKLAWPYLAGGVIAVTLVVPEAVYDWTGGSLGGVGGVLVAGVTLLLASFAGYRIRAGATD